MDVAGESKGRRGEHSYNHTECGVTAQQQQQRASHTSVGDRLWQMPRCGGSPCVNTPRGAHSGMHPPGHRCRHGAWMPAPAKCPLGPTLLLLSLPVCCYRERGEGGEAVRPRRHDRRGVGGGGWMLAAASATSSTVQHGADREEKQTHIRSV